MSAVPPLHRPLQLTRGLRMGLLGSVIFSATLPLKKLAVGSVGAPQLSGWCVIVGCAAVATLLSAGWMALPSGLVRP